MPRLPPSTAVPTHAAAARGWHRAGVGLIVAMALLVAALGLRWLVEVSSDLPSLAQLARDGREIYAPALEPGAGFLAGLAHGHAPGARALKRAWLTLNGQIDARGLATLAVILHATAIGGLLLFLRRQLRLAWVALLAVGTVTLHLLSNLGSSLFNGDAAWSAALVLLSLLHLAGMGATRAGSWRWWVGFGAGACNIAAFTPGLASAAALLVWLARADVGEGAERKRDRHATLAANAVLLVGAGVLVALRASGLAEIALGSSSLGAVLSWPFTPGWGAGVVWAPIFFCLVRWLRTGSADATATGLALPALWILLQTALLTTAPASGPALVLGVIVNAACLTSLPGGALAARMRNLFLASAWSIFVFDAATQPAAGWTKFSAASNETIAAFRQPQATANSTAPAATRDATAEEIRTVATLFARPELSRLLPPSARPTLAVRAEENANGRAGAPAFQPDAAPDLPVRDGLPAFGTWSAAGGTATGEFVSAPLVTTFPILQLRIAGTLRPPTTSLVLRTDDGKEIEPLVTTLSALDRWNRVNFVTPSGAFRLVARDNSTTDWLAFTPPVEIGRASRLASKLPRLWPWVFGAGCGALGLALTTALRASSVARENAAPTEPFLNWRVVPWVGVLAYAVFFSNHLDTTAGPNDSGGYLNLAKTLLEGRLTAAPRMLFPEDGATDITPYVPTTFHATADGRMSAEYPVGLPLEIWALGQFMPLEKAVPTLILLQLTLGVVFTWRLGRVMGLSDGWAWLAAGIVGLSPVYLFQGLQPQSDGPALVWVTAAVGWAWTSREKPWHAVFAGLATALAVLIRPSNVLCLVPVAICLWGSGRRFAAWALAGLPAALWLLWYQQTLYGSWHSTGYGDVSSGFGLRFIPLTLRSYALWLPELFTPVVALAFAAPFLRSIPLRVRAVLVAWCAAFGAFYAVYWCTWDNWYNMRFVLPAMPAALVLALLVARTAIARLATRDFFPAGASRVAAAAIVVAALFGWLGLRIAQRRVVYWTYVNREHAVGARWLRDQVPANSVIFAKPATNPLMYYTDFTFVRSDHPAVKDNAALFERIARAGRPVYALTYHWEAKGLDRSRNLHGDGRPDLPGEWERVAAVWDDDMFVWRQRTMARGVENR